MYSVIVLCAGQGKRTGLHYNKMFYRLNDKTVYEMTLDCFLQDEREEFEKLSYDSRIEFVLGGLERQDSVYSGLQNVQYDYVLIHDGARPYVKMKLIDDLLECLKEHVACLLMVPSKDTVKRVVNGKVIETLKRDELMQAQTPQAFLKDVIVEAYQKGIESHFFATDDAQMVEVFTHHGVFMVMGDYENKKITTPEDLS